VKRRADLFVFPSIHSSSINPYIHPSIHSSIHLSIHPFIHQFIRPSVHLSVQARTLAFTLGIRDCSFPSVGHRCVLVTLPYSVAPISLVIMHTRTCTRVHARVHASAPHVYTVYTRACALAPAACPSSNCASVYIVVSTPVQCHLHTRT
jgi:hypothetical protein